MASSQTALRGDTSSSKHIHLQGDVCPYCDQQIPNDKAEEIRARFSAKERELEKAMNARLDQDRARIEANAAAAVEKLKQDGVAAVAKAQADGEAKLVAAREDARKAAEAIHQERIAQLVHDNASLQTASREQVAIAQRQQDELRAQLDAVKAGTDQEVGKRVHEVREALEKQNTIALNAKDAKHFGETQKLTGKLADLQRQLEKKTNDELGEGAEIDLLESLKAEFPEDLIEHIGKKERPGADIRHTVRHNGKDCGLIIYDSKNSMAWRSDYVDKLAKDQRAVKADHAILSTRQFPKNTAQLHLDGGVIIANAARVVAVVQILRKHLVHSHTLRLSGTERVKKTAAMYDFITSKRYAQLLDSIDTQAEELLKLQEKEMKAHQTVWKQQGSHYRSIQKTRADIGLEIDSIIELE